MGTLVGRDAELARLRGLLHDAAAGRAVTGLVSGDAGIGKSRLVAEAMRIAERDGFTVLCGQCAEIGDSVPYLPFADAFRAAAPPIEKAIKARPVLSRLLPDGDGQAQEADWAGLARQQMFGAVLSLLSELAAATPVLLVVEDLHWADATTRHLVTFLARMLHRERVAIIGTYRSDDLHSRHPLRGVIAELLRLPSVALVELGPLSAAALGEILSSEPDRPLPLSAATLNSLVERAEGNAYYAEELVTASSWAEGTLPTGLAALLLSRVERVSDAAQQVLRAAAVAGGGAADDLVRAASGLPDDAYDDALREAAGHQLLAPDGPDGYRFRHALLREAVYGDLMPGERTRLHARLASLLATRPAETGPGTAAELAHHCMASHDIPGAFGASVRAGSEAERLGAPAEAHRHYDRALELWVRVEGAERIAGMTRGKLGLKSALAAAVSGDVPRAVQLLRRIRGWVSDEAVTAESAELRGRVGERLAYHLLQGENTQWYAEALDVAEATVRETQDEPPTWYRARAMATYAIALSAAHRDDDARDWASRARAAARAAGSASVEADALATTGQLALRTGSSGEAIGLFTAAVEQAGAAGAVGVRLRAVYQLATERLVRGELAEAASVAHRGVEWAEAEGLGLAPFGLDLQHLHFQAHFADGCWDHAQELADGFPVRVTRQSEALLSAMALFVDVARGNPVVSERRTWLEPFWEDVFVAYIARGILAEHALWQGDCERALAEAGAAIDADAWPAHSPSVIRVTAIALAARADRAARLRATGDAAGADAEAAAGAALLGVAADGASYPARPKAVLGPEGRGWLARCEAEYARLTGTNSPAVWERVLAEFGPGYVYETARGQWRLAEALVEAGRRDEAAAVWRAARATAARLRAAPLAAALDDLARRARLDPGNVSRGGHGHESGGPNPLAALTDREREVLSLLARGMSNREIGTELFITPKTASVHVSNILGKLGAASRTEAAAIAHRESV
jgi:DNA-binding CsgD family transcriptional regulator